MIGNGPLYDRGLEELKRVQKVTPVLQATCMGSSGEDEKRLLVKDQPGQQDPFAEKFGCVTFNHTSVIFGCAG